MNITMNLLHPIVTEEIDVSITDLAKAFWEMNSEHQADFFDALAGVIDEDSKNNSSAYSLGELQWCYLKEELRKPGRERANEMHMALSAFAYEFVSQKPEGCRS